MREPNVVERSVKELAGSMRRAGLGVNLWTLFADHGKSYHSDGINLDDELYVDTLVKKLGGPKAFKIKACFQNSQTLLCDDWQSRFKYHEGYIMSQHVPIPIHHAWLTIHDTVIDLTAQAIKRQNKDRRDEIVEYFGIEIPRELVLENMVTTKVYGPVTENPELAPQAFGYKDFKDLIKKGR
jgi:hypothetical protein